MLDGMTNIKASEVLKEIKYYTEDLPPYSPDEVAEALEMAIKALEAQRNLTNEELYQSFIDLEAENERLHDALEAQQNRCDSCTHFKEQDGSSCYECVKGMADNFEAQPKTSYISVDLNKWAKEVAEKALDEITYEGKTIREWAEIIVKQPSETIHGCTYGGVSWGGTYEPQQPCEDCISRQAVIDFIIDNYGVGFNSLTNGIRDYLPSVTPKRPKGKWIDFNWNDGDICRWGIKCSECHTEYKHGGEMWHNPKFCPNCGAEMGGAND